MSNNITMAEVVCKITEANKIVVLTHENPDGDAIGSAAGLTGFLRDLNKHTELLFASELPPNYRKFVKINYKTEFSQSEIESADLVIQLDTATAKRIAAPPGLEISDKLPLLVIDHHGDNSRYGKWNFVQPAAATAQITLKIAEIIDNMAITPDTATLFMLGVVTDTGGFRFDNANEESFAAAAALLGKKAEYRKIIDAIFFSDTLTRRKFEAELLERHMELREDGKLAIVKIPEKLINDYQIDMSTTEGLIDAFRSIEGIELVALLYYRKSDLLKVSLRARNPERPAGPIARALGGGGHEMAAGCTIPNGDMDEVAERISALFQGEKQ